MHRQLNYPKIDSIWLIGSRANNSHREDSDWDFFIFADKNVLEDLKIDKSLKSDKIDLFIVFDGDDFESPWPVEKGAKKGNLILWEWDKISDNEATYKSEKYKSEENWFKNDMFDNKTLKAIKVWSK